MVFDIDTALAEEGETSELAAEVLIQTPETALPVEADSVSKVPAGGGTAPAQDTPADEPVQVLPGPSTPETAATEGKESDE